MAGAAPGRCAALAWRSAEAAMLKLLRKRSRQLSLQRWRIEAMRSVPLPAGARSCLA